MLLRTCTRVAHSQSLVELGDRQERPLNAYIKNPSKFVMNPGNAVKRHFVVEDRLKALKEYSET